MEVLQVASELEQMVDLYRTEKPRRVLEIGCWDGGTLRVWLQEGSPAVVVAVDLEHRNPGAYAGWRKPETRLIVHTGSSYSEKMIELIAEQAPYDWAFVDGDHGDAGVRSDVEICLRVLNPGGLLLLHDIVGDVGQSHPQAPGVVFDELKQKGHETLEFIDPKPEPWAHGIGVIRC